MRKIVVAGAGHGGLTAAVMLAKKGYDVTVFENQDRAAMGWDWHDMMVLTAFDEAGIERPSGEFISPAIPMAYYPPDKKTRIDTPASTNADLVYIDRKALSAHLINEAEKSGVKLIFNTEVLGAVIANGKVAGVNIRKNGKISAVEAELVIDAAGIDSPVRKSLPNFTGIQNEIPDNKTFFVYRAYYERPSGLEDRVPYSIYLFHCNNKGMDWSIVGEDFVDLLVGSFDRIDDGVIDAAVSDFKKEFNLENSKITRGGAVGKIPLTKTLSKFVFDGYAAVGDSACMTEPMSGSGITLSMAAGRILAERIIELGEKEFTTENLWKYQYTYLKKIGMRYFGSEILKNALKKLSANDINYFVNNKIIGEAELKSGGMKIEGLEDAVNKALKFFPKLYTLPVLSEIPIKTAFGKNVKKLLPERYDEKSFAKWQKQYEMI